jgi:hypothetical protein
MEGLFQLLYNHTPVGAGYVFADNMEEVGLTVERCIANTRVWPAANTLAKEHDRHVVPHLQEIPSLEQLCQVAFDETLIHEIAIVPTFQHLPRNLDKECKSGTPASEDGLGHRLSDKRRVRLLSVDVDGTRDGSVRSEEFDLLIPINNSAVHGPGHLPHVCSRKADIAEEELDMVGSCFVCVVEHCDGRRHAVLVQKSFAQSNVQ